MNGEARRQLAEYLRFQRELGIETVGFGRVPAAAGAGLNTAAAGKTSTRELPAQNAPPAGTREAGSARKAPPLPVLKRDVAALLQQVREDIGDCTRCKLHSLGRKQIVFGVGNPNAELVFVGEAPGADEDARGIPFVGRAGQLLTDMIEKGMGVRRDDIYICNIIKCRPPENRTPEPDECETCRPFVLAQLDAIKPRLVIALGAVAAQNLLQYKGSLGSVRGRMHDLRVGDTATKLLVTYHPAYLLRDPSQKKEAWKDLQVAMKYLGIPLPG